MQLLAPLRVGPAVADASIVVVAVHGRDQSAGYLVEHLVDPLEERGMVPDDVSWILPRSPAHRWYSGRAADPVAANEDELRCALATLDALAEQLEAPPAVLVGFSQGGCVVAEAIARRPAPWAGAAVLTGTLLGPEPGSRPIDAEVAGVPIVFATGDGDPWMSPSSAEASAEAFRSAGALAEVIVSSSADHEIHPADLDAIAGLITRCLGADRPAARRPPST